MHNGKKISARFARRLFIRFPTFSVNFSQNYLENWKFRKFDVKIFVRIWIRPGAFLPS